MVKMDPQYRDIALYYPTESLLLQVAQWVHTHPYYHLRLVCSVHRGSVLAALKEAAAAIIDATERPDAAANMLEQIGKTARSRVVVYTEFPHEGLELFVRVRGVMFLLGPMEPEHWESFFERIESAGSARRFEDTRKVLPATASDRDGLAGVAGSKQAQQILHRNT